MTTNAAITQKQKRQKNQNSNPKIKTHRLSQAVGFSLPDLYRYCLDNGCKGY